MFNFKKQNAKKLLQYKYKHCIPVSNHNKTLIKSGIILVVDLVLPSQSRQLPDSNALYCLNNLALLQMVAGAGRKRVGRILCPCISNNVHQ